MSLHRPPSTYILRELVDVEIASSVSWFPQTIGWKIVFFIVVIGCLFTSYRLIKNWWENRYRKEAITLLNALNMQAEGVEYHIYSILKKVLVHLDNKSAKTFGSSYLNQLDSLNMSNEKSAKGIRSQGFKFNSEFGENWMGSLIEADKALTRDQKITLRYESILWLRTHKKGQR